ncbi:hypothetical protein AUR64_13275 [Haloprofundus marisrubri]|uniref:Uncharacterized protein n=1 Tax=Haloprofundus marisrubri TaxID=1514971 RepID=A0A0W1R5U7_9EURY|nr:hypothetical protein [Haloprofundus marisrubri]KTG08792.1 hypothetical protein AUR64_13275 [Haloprofundus marisrubri]
MAPSPTPRRSVSLSVPPSDGPDDGDGRRIEWRAAPDGNLADLARHGFIGLVVAVLSLAAALVVFASLDAPSDGLDRGWLLLVMLFVGGPASLLYLAAAVGVDGSEAVASLFPGVDTLSLPRVTAAALVGGVVLLMVLLHPLLPVAYGVGLVALYVVDKARHTEGSLDAESATLGRPVADSERRHDISSLSGYRSVRLGRYVVCWLQFDDMALNAPRVVVFPASSFPAIRAALDEIRAATEDTDSDPAVRIAAGLLGLLFLGVAAFIVVGIGNPRLSAYAVSILGLFAALLLFAAWQA